MCQLPLLIYWAQYLIDVYIEQPSQNSLCESQRTLPLRHLILMFYFPRTKDVHAWAHNAPGEALRVIILLEEGRHFPPCTYYSYPRAKDISVIGLLRKWQSRDLLRYNRHRTMNASCVSVSHCCFTTSAWVGGRVLSVIPLKASLT